MYKKERFGTYELQYDTILDHDVYQYLRVTFEVARGQTEMATVLLNGTPIGEVYVVREGTPKKITGYTSYRFYRYPNGTLERIRMTKDRPFKTVGHAAAAIITDFIT